MSEPNSINPKLRLYEKLADKVASLPPGMFSLLMVIGGLFWIAYQVVPYHIGEMKALVTGLEASHREERDRDRDASREERDQWRTFHKTEVDRIERVFAGKPPAVTGN